MISWNWHRILICLSYCEHIWVVHVFCWGVCICLPNFCWMSWMVIFLENVFFFFFFLKNRYLIQGPTNPRGPIPLPTCGGPVLSQSKLCMDFPTEIGTNGNGIWDLERNKLQDPKPTTRPTPNGFFLENVNFDESC